MNISLALNYRRDNQRRFLAELREFISFQSISGEAGHRSDMRRCADWLAAHLEDIGLKGVGIIPTPNHPVVYAEWKQSPGLPTLLIYGHYDVQPAEPLDKWESPPFKAVIKDKYIYGRGAADDKGQMFALIKSLEAYLQSRGSLPINVKCIFEGEEEIGSKSLIDLLKSRKELFRADAALLSDMPMLAMNKPAITYAMRGALGLELVVCGPSQDLHSGNFGGALHNPVHALSEIIAGLHDGNGKITIPGFYDRVENPDIYERRYLRRFAAPDMQILKDSGSMMGWGEDGFSMFEKTTMRPALSVTSIKGGYQGGGAKAIIPARASAKLDIRLVKGQDPTEIAGLFREHIARVTPPAVRSYVKTGFAAKPAVVGLRNRFTQAAASALQKSFGAHPVFLRLGGTIPVVSTIQEVFNIPVMMLGFALPGDNLHSPNERFYIPNFLKGIDTGIWLLKEILEETKGKSPIGPERRADYDH